MSRIRPSPLFVAIACGFAFVTAALAGPPDNDECFSAAVINSVPYNTSVDTTFADADPPEGSCNSTLVSFMWNSVWYRWTPSQTGLATITVDMQYDAIVVVHSGSCSGLSEVDCWDEPQPITFSWIANGGWTYYIQIGDYGISPGGGPTDINLVQQTAATGRCCTLTGCSVTTAANCASVGGRYDGDGTDCSVQCCPDLNGDNRTNEPDLGILLQNWRGGAGGDLTGDGQTDESDLGVLLQNWRCGEL